MLTQNGCNACRATWPTDASPSAPTMDAVSESLPETVSPPDGTDEECARRLKAANLSLASGNYTTAAWQLDRVATEGPPALLPEAIYLTGLLEADPENPAGDMARAQNTLAGIEKKYPDFDRTGEVRIVTGLLVQMQHFAAENQTLQGEIQQLEKRLLAAQKSVRELKRLLQKLKEIDLEISPEEP